MFIGSSKTESMLAKFNNSNMPQCMLLFNEAIGVREPFIAALRDWPDAIEIGEWKTFSNPQRTTGQIELAEVDCEFGIIHERLEAELFSSLKAFEQSVECVAALDEYQTAISIECRRADADSTNFSVADTLVRVIADCAPRPSAIVFPLGRVAWTPEEFGSMSQSKATSDWIDWFSSSGELASPNTSSQTDRWFRTHGLKLFGVPDVLCSWPRDDETADVPPCVRTALDSLPAYLVKLGDRLPVGDMVELERNDWVVRDSRELPAWIHDLDDGDLCFFAPVPA